MEGIAPMLFSDSIVSIGGASFSLQHRLQPMSETPAEADAAD